MKKLLSLSALTILAYTMPIQTVQAQSKPPQQRPITNIQQMGEVMLRMEQKIYELERRMLLMAANMKRGEEQLDEISETLKSGNFGSGDKSKATQRQSKELSPLAKKYQKMIEDYKKGLD